MLSQRRRRLSVLSSTCQHVATLQFVSGAETDKFRAPPPRPHPCFPRPRWDWLRLRVCPWKACPPKQAYVYSFDISVFLQPALCRFACRKAFPRKQAYVYSLDSSVFLWLRKQRPKIRARPAQGYFRMKDVDRRIEAIAQVSVESKEEKVERAEFSVPRRGHTEACQWRRDRQTKSPPPRPHPCFPRPRWDWLRLRVCPWKACPPKQAYVYSFDISVFLQPALCRFACRKAFPRKQVEVDSVDTGHHCFSVVAQATPQDSCKASPRLFSNERRG